MEIQLKELLQQIKTEGVDKAQTEADTILENAHAEAKRIVDDAKAQAEKIIADAKLQTERMKKSGEDAITQAGRNLLITFRESVTRELGVILSEKVEAAYSSDEFTKLILSAVENFTKTPDAENLTVILSSSDLEKLEGMIMAALKEKIEKGITLRANDNFTKGFRIAVDGGSAYYDYSAEAVVDMLSNYLSPRVTELLKEA